VSLSAHFEVRRPQLTVSFDLEARSGEVVGLIGPNGAGKTTVLRALSGLLPLSSGQISVNDQVVATADRQVPAYRRSVGFLFQDHSLFEHLSALDNVAFGLRTRGTSRPAARAVARRWLAEVGASDLADRRPRELSGGQGQRVALARALAADPELVLLDEPTASLDATVAMALRTALRDHLSRLEAVSVLVTHTALDALVVADRIVVLEAGRVVQVGSPGEVAARPRTQHVATLVGMNLLRGHSDGETLRLSGGATVVTTVKLSGPAFVAFAPSAVSVYADRPTGSPRNVWAGTVSAITPHGDAIRIQIAGPAPLLADITPGSLTALGLRIGVPVWVSVKATEVTAYPLNTCRS
jgi:molybdate transport system ATP-binding protein